jgi:hypothetical protein
MMFRIVFWDVLLCKMIVDHRFTRQYIPEDNASFIFELLCTVLIFISSFVLPCPATGEMFYFCVVSITKLESPVRAFPAVSCKSWHRTLQLQENGENSIFPCVIYSFHRKKVISFVIVMLTKINLAKLLHHH